MNINLEGDMKKQQGFSGQFIITGISRHTDRCNRDYSCLEVNSGSGPTVILAWDGAYSGPAGLRPGLTVNITGDYLPNGGKRRCETLVIVDDPWAEKEYQRSARLLNTMNRCLSSPALDLFITSLVVNGPLAERFRNQPASWFHHQSYTHGLFIHSVDVAYRLFENSRIIRAEKPLAVMLGLAHDIGKAWLQENGASWRPGMDHDKVVLLALEPTISQIESEWPDLKDDLIQVLCLRMGSKKERKALPARIDGLQVALRAADEASCVEGWSQGSRGEPAAAKDVVCVPA